MEISKDKIQDYIGKPVLMGHGNISYAWAGILKKACFKSPNGTIGSVILEIENHAALINNNEKIKKENVDYKQFYISGLHEWVVELEGEYLEYYKEVVGFPKILLDINANIKDSFISISSNKKPLEKFNSDEIKFIEELIEKKIREYICPKFICPKFKS